jgi:hypothetical protein
MWDDISSQLFTTEPADLDMLIREYSGDPKLKLYFVDLDREYSTPDVRSVTNWTSLPGASEHERSLTA